ncbi:MAG: Small-conductance mechanosensitive channel [candidate division WS6 bacterium OLB20]|uniref:Small-conductance mechanosensitive channel n=1 Tax=candidate division WS6 bacterium OLB20 TaxID=1617426 RepID=A0A136M0J8_9BACT|nr:MAG: Small-conductance mechanosensitive channel [candidate division WS6 bacterium OLB20]
MNIPSTIRTFSDRLVAGIPAELVLPLQIMIIFTATLIILNLIRMIIKKRVSVIIRKSPFTADDLFLRIVDGFDGKLFIVVSLYTAVRLTQSPDWLSQMATILMIVFGVLYGVGVFQKIIGYAVERYVRSRGDGAAYEKSVSGFIIGLSTLLLWSLAGLMVLQNIGFDVSALLGGLGIAGIAIGFAVQSLLEDIFSFFSIYFDKPFKEGDFVVVGQDMGKIKHVGVKSTRIKSLNGEEIVIPNKEMTSTRINNFAELEKRTKIFTFGIEYGTPVEKVKKVQKIVSKIFDELENSELGRCHLKFFGDSALIFEILYHIQDPAYETYIEERHQFNVRLLEEFRKAGISMAFPTQTVHIRQD